MDLARCLNTIGCFAVTLTAGFGCVQKPGPDVGDGFPSLAPGARVELVDVALAWPLPAGTGVGDGGHMGPILDCETLGIFEPLTRDDEPEDLCAALTVTAARLDPCFRDGAKEGCQPQLRLVVQPVFDGVARDAALHVFYAIDEDVLLQAVARMIELRQVHGDSGQGALGVHPLLVDSAGRRAVAAVLDGVIATARLEHFTQITVHGDDAAWTFESREFVDGKVSAFETHRQHVLSARADVIDISVTPSSGSPDEFVLLLDEAAAAAAPHEAQQIAFDRAGRVENPDFHDPGTIDCATCHVAAPARAAARARGTFVDGADTFQTTRHDLTSSAVFANPQFIHAFAWRGTSLAINQRLVNEAARSADLLDARLTEQGVLR